MSIAKVLRAGLMAVVVVGLAMGGLALAQTGDGDSSGPAVPRGAYERIIDLLAPLVDDGTLTTDQAAAVAEHLSDRLPVTDRRPTDAAPRLAELLGLTPEELHEELAAGATISTLAEAQGLELEDLVAELLAPLRARLAAAVDAGELSEAEAAERLAAAQERVARRLAGAHGGATDRRVDAVRDTLGVTATELREAAEAGQSLADVAEANDVPTDELVAVLVAPAAERLQDAVTAGELTEEEAAAQLARIEEEAAARVDEPLTDRPRRDRPRRDG